LYDKFLFGSVDTAVNIDPERFERVTVFSNEKRESCKTCFAYWNCAGVCPNNRASYSDAQFEALCRFTKKMMRHELETALTD
jgi:radical SAM protein with 4Fe4S-binding SPASM domain